MIDFLKTQQLSEPYIKQLLANSRTFKVPKRTILLKENNISTHVYFVQSGILRTGIRDANNKEWTQYFFQAEGLRWAGISHKCLNGMESDIFIEVMEDAEITAFPIEFLRELWLSNTQWVKFFNCQMMPTLRFGEQKNIESVKYSPEKRYLDFVETQPQIIQNIPLIHIASYLGMTPESLSRIRKKLVVKT
jgi:CRP/FNR family transcriptional regulator, anaerobic regulatory protein